MPIFTHDVDEEKHRTQRKHRWSAKMDGFEINIYRDGDDGMVRVDIAADAHFRGRVPFLTFAPTSPADLENLATHGPAIFRAVATAVSEALGTDDWRSRWDKQRDEMNERFGLSNRGE